MARSFRRACVTLVLPVCVAVAGIAGSWHPARGSEDPQTADGAKVSKDGPSLPASPGGDSVGPFVPLRPATVDDRRETEIARLFSAARGLEDAHSWAEAAALLKDALKLEPDSVAIARRLCRIYLGPLSKPDQAVEFGKRVLIHDPADSDTLIRLVDYFDKVDPRQAEDLLKQVLANPKLDVHAPARLLAEFELGKLYSSRLRQVDKAADAFAKVVVGLDDRSANQLAPAHQLRILGHQPSVAYLNFGFVFLAARKLELAAKAFERGLVYDEDNPQISLLLAETLLKLNRGPAALEQVERSIRRQPQGVEAYELLAKVLTGLKRENEITPRLEEAARRDSKNIPLQYVLADRYRETGHAQKAEALYRELLNSQPTPQTYRALAASLFKRKRSADLLKVLCEALKRRDGAESEAVSAQLQGAAADDEMAESMLDSGFEQLSANPPALPRTAGAVLAFLANSSRTSPQRERRLEKLLKVQRLLLESDPSALNYTEIADTERRLGRFAAAANTLQEMLAKYPAERSVRTLSFLADFHRRAGHHEALKLVLDEALKLDPSDGESQSKLGRLLADVGRIDEAVRVFRAAAKREPANPTYDLFLGGILTKFGRNDEAVKVFESLLKRFSANEEVVKFTRQSLSIAYVNLGNYAKGEAELEILLQNNPDEAGPNNDLGYLYAEQGKNLEKAESMIRKALRDEPENRSYLDSLGWVLFKRGKAKEALEPMKKAVGRMRAEAEQEGDNLDATILEHLGDVYFGLGEIDKAADAWRQARTAGERAVPPEKRLPEIKKKLDSLEKMDTGAKPSSRQNP